MSEENKNLKSNFIGRTKIRPEGLQNGGSNEKQYSYFGIERNNKTIRRFKLILRSGKQVSIPYAFLPVIVLENEGFVCIKTKDISISIKGRGLKPLEEYLSKEVVRWIKESVSKRDTKETEDFISEIVIDGDMDL